MVADQFLLSPNIPTLQDIEKAIKNQQDGDGYQAKTEKIKSPRQFLNVDGMLTNFFSGSFKVTPSLCVSARYVKKATKDVQTLLNGLNVKLDIPENFDEDKRLDNLDVAILNMLSEKTVHKADRDVCELLPPNLHSLVGLRSLLIKYSTDSSEYISADSKKLANNQIKCDIMQQLLQLSEQTRQQIKTDRELFYRRFQALFKWPAILTLENPSPELLGASSGIITPSAIKVQRTYSRADRNKTVDRPEKETEVSEAAGSSAEPAPLTLTPVTNKSILEDLLVNQSKKLFSMRTVKCGSDTKTVIKEIDFRTNRALIEATASSSESACDSKVDRVGLASSTKTVDVVEPVAKKRKLSRFVLGQGECIIFGDGDEGSYVSSDDGLGDKSEDDEDDLKKLESFLLKQQSQGVVIEPGSDEDFEDLKKLENFLKEQDEDDINFI